MYYLSLLKALLRLKRNEKKTKEQLQKYQDDQLKNLLRYAFYHSKYYRQSFIAAGITQENINSKRITDFPVIDKNILIEHFDELVTVNDVTQKEMREFDEIESQKEKRFKEKYHLIHSSGSTGLPAFFLYDENAWKTMMIGIIRAALWDMSLFQIVKFLIEKPKVMYLAATDGRYGGAMAVGAGIDGLHMQQRHLDVQSPLNEWRDSVNEFRPDIIIGYPSAIKILADLIQEDKLCVHLTRVITCGEPLHPALEKMFAQTFGCPVVNIYGASESLALGVGISEKKGIYLFDDLNLIEIVDDQIYLTCFYNYVQPIIRYRLSDRLEVLKKEKLDRPFTKVKTIIGRNEDLLWFEDEKGDKEFIHPLSVEGISVDGLRDYQFHKIDKKTFEIFVQIDPKSNAEQIEEAIVKKMQEVLLAKQLSYVEFTVKFVDGIYPDRNTGKKKLIIL